MVTKQEERWTICKHVYKNTQSEMCFCLKWKIRCDYPHGTRPKRHKRQETRERWTHDNWRGTQDKISSIHIEQSVPTLTLSSQLVLLQRVSQAIASTNRKKSTNYKFKSPKSGGISFWIGWNATQNFRNFQKVSLHVFFNHKQRFFEEFRLSFTPIAKPFKGIFWPSPASRVKKVRR